VGRPGESERSEETERERSEETERERSEETERERSEETVADSGVTRVFYDDDLMYKDIVIGSEEGAQGLIEQPHTPARRHSHRHHLAPYRIAAVTAPPPL
jgi:hypothetical protein